MQPEARGLLLLVVSKSAGAHTYLLDVSPVENIGHKPVPTTAAHARQCNATVGLVYSAHRSLSHPYLHYIGLTAEGCAKCSYAQRGRLWVTWSQGE